MTEEFEPKAKADLFENFKPKTAFFLGLAGGALVLGTIGFFIMLAVSLSPRDANQAKVNQAPVGNPSAGSQAATPQPNYAAVPEVDTENDNIRGNKKAKVTIIEYSDFECPFCQKVEPTLEQVAQAYGDKVRIVYRHFPLSIHPYAAKAAEAAQCAAAQGKFWEMHAKLFSEQGALSSLITQASGPKVAGRLIVPVQTSGGAQYADITQVIPAFKQQAQDLGLNAAKFNSCLDEGKTAERVASDLQQAVAALPADLQGTPAIFITDNKNNKDFLPGAYPFEKFKEIIDGMLAK